MLLSLVAIILHATFHLNPVTSSLFARRLKRYLRAGFVYKIALAGRSPAPRRAFRSLERASRRGLALRCVCLCRSGRARLPDLCVGGGQGEQGALCSRFSLTLPHPPPDRNPLVQLSSFCVSFQFFTSQPSWQRLPSARPQPGCFIWLQWEGRFFSAFQEQTGYFESLDLMICISLDILYLGLMPNCVVVLLFTQMFSRRRAFLTTKAHGILTQKNKICCKALRSNFLLVTKWLLFPSLPMLSSSPQLIHRDTV
nr:uncharacterized protein LOC106731508 [Pelodiscus sinensis]|eukprot:XP_025037106.1 uncharacterized protein LOC106731508 [Pelodiscus sinensis]